MLCMPPAPEHANRVHEPPGPSVAARRIAVRRAWSVQVTCGTTVKLQHIGTNYHLHSHEVAYGSGSGQQSVTASSAGDDAGSYWVVKGPEVHTVPTARSLAFVLLFSTLLERTPRFTGRSLCIRHEVLGGRANATRACCIRGGCELGRMLVLLLRETHCFAAILP